VSTPKKFGRARKAVASHIRLRIPVKNDTRAGKLRSNFLAGVVGGNFPQAGKGAGGIGYGTLLRIGP
jgi:hypothetical protein